MCNNIENANYKLYAIHTGSKVKEQGAVKNTCQHFIKIQFEVVH